MLRAAGSCQEKDLEGRRDRGESSILGSRVRHPPVETVIGGCKAGWRLGAIVSPELPLTRADVDLPCWSESFKCAPWR